MSKLNLMKFMGKHYDVPSNAACIKQDGDKGKPMWFVYRPEYKQTGVRKWEWEKIPPQGVMWNYCGEPVVDTRNLCNSCKNDFATCKPGCMKLGFGIDNVIECDIYELWPQEMKPNDTFDIPEEGEARN